MDDVNVHAIASQCLDGAGGNIVAGTEALRELAMREPPVYYALTRSLLKEACYDAIRSVQRGKRKAIWTAPNYDKGGNGERLAHLAASMYDIPLPNGIRLGEATRDDLLAAQEFYEAQAKTMAHFGRFYATVAEKVSGRKKVKNALTSEQLRDIQRDTK